MGVPKLFHSLIETYHHNNATNPTGYNIIKKDIDNNLPTHFYLDFNGGIYQCIKPEIKTEESLILYVVEYLELLCTLNLQIVNFKRNLSNYNLIYKSKWKIKKISETIKKAILNQASMPT